MYQRIGLAVTIIILSGCTLLPVTIPTGVSVALWAQTAVDSILFMHDKPTTTEMILNETTGKDCRFFNIVEGKKLCRENEEHYTDEFREDNGEME